MFILVQLKDTIRISAEDSALLNRDPLHVLRSEINSVYCNKIIPDIGQCIIVHSILSFDDPFIWPSDPCPYVHCVFRVVVYQAKANEIIQCKIRAASKDKIILTTDFFTNIIVEPDQLPDGTKWKDEENSWVWDNSGAEYFYEVGSVVRAKILSSKFATTIDPNVAAAEDIAANPKAIKYGYVRPPPAAPPATPLPLTPVQSSATPATALPGAPAPGFEKASYVHPLTIYASLKPTGLGPLEWWE